MSMKPPVGSNTLRYLRMLHMALLVGQLLFAGIAVYLKYTNATPSALAHLDNTLQVVALLLCFGGYLGGSFVAKRNRQRALDGVLDVQAKAEGYRSASIIQWALLEGPSLFSIISFLLTGNIAFLALSATMMFLLLMAAPSKMKVMLLYRLNEREMEMF